MRLEHLVWPASDLVGAIDALATTLGASVTRARVGTDDVVEAAHAAGLEAESLLVLPAELDAIAAAAPALWRCPDGSYLVLGRQGRRVEVITPRGRTRVRGHELVEAIAEAVTARYRPMTADVLERAGLPAGARERVGGALVREWLSPGDCGRLWIVTRRARGIRDEVSRTSLPRDVTGFLLAHVAQLALFLGAWRLIGPHAFAGELDAEVAFGWALLAASMVVAQLARSWFQGRIGLIGGALLKRVLMKGTLESDLDDAERSGAGDTMSRVIDAEAVERAVLTGGVSSLTALVDAVAVVWILSNGFAPAILIFAFGLWFTALIVLALRLLDVQRRWTNARLRLTDRLVGNLVGHRTRLVQGDRETWHDAEDSDLADYATVSRQLDRLEVGLTVLLPRAWLVTSLVALAIGSIASTTAVGLLLAIAGALLGQRAFAGLGAGVRALAIAHVSIQKMLPLLRRAHPLPSADLALPPGTPAEDEPTLEAQNLMFRYRGRPDPVLDGASIRLDRRSRVVLTGVSGSGKSTLAAVLTGLRRADSGRLRLAGLDPTSRGERAWRRRVALTPQVHTNHVFSGTLAWNLLMSRPLPHTGRDVEDAERVCLAVGLGTLLERMPGGVRQQIGDGGWRLSHGEAARLFIARSLLQKADVLVVDEGLEALDPATAERCVGALEAAEAAVVLVAHR